MNNSNDTLEPEKVVREERTCKLIATEETINNKYPVLACSECGCVQSIYAVFNYCPNCGCKVVY